MEAAAEQGAAAPAGVSAGDTQPSSAARERGRPLPAESLRPGRVLALDVGAGTTDILLTRPDQPLENAVKLVVPSRTQVVAAQIAAATRRGLPVFFDGMTMGGGADAAAMKAHLAAGLSFHATPAAALTFADDLERVRRFGVTIVEPGHEDDIPHDAVRVAGADLDPDRLRAAFELLGVDPAADAVAIAVQDHGFSPHGSNRVLRFRMWEEAAAEGRRLKDLFYDADAIPSPLSRLRAAARQAASYAPGVRVLAADTGPAALYGAMPDDVESAILVNVGNGHTVCAVALGDRLAGVFEHHTGRLDGPGLDQRLRRFLSGDLTSDEVREDGGHGAVLAATARQANLRELPLFATGPRRVLLERSTLPFRFAAPHGDMMLTGCFGLLRAVQGASHNH